MVIFFHFDYIWAMYHFPLLLAINSYFAFNYTMTIYTLYICYYFILQYLLQYFFSKTPSPTRPLYVNWYHGIGLGAYCNKKTKRGFIFTFILFIEHIFYKVFCLNLLLDSKLLKMHFFHHNLSLSDIFLL